MSPEDFRFFQRFLKERSGLHLAEEKQYLLETRLGRLLRAHGLPGLGALARALASGDRPELEAAIIEAMTTNETYFFRDRAPFDLLRERLLPDLIATRAESRRLSIWCAAAATGQEPYSIAMILDEFRPKLTGWKVDILATDICESVIGRAREGVYSQFEVQRGLPIRRLLGHFEKIGETNWRISKEMRAKVAFRTLNLMNDFGAIGRFDIVFCRNVLIYFDQPTRQAVLRRVQRHLAPDGALVLGAAETLIGLDTAFASTREAPGCYRMARPLASVA